MKTKMQQASAKVGSGIKSALSMVWAALGFYFITVLVRAFALHWGTFDEIEHRDWAMIKAYAPALGVAVVCLLWTLGAHIEARKTGQSAGWIMMKSWLALVIGLPLLFLAGLMIYVGFTSLLPQTPIDDAAEKTIEAPHVEAAPAATDLETRFVADDVTLTAAEYIKGKRLHEARLRALAARNR